MRTCIHCGLTITDESTDAWEAMRWVTLSRHGSNRHCRQKNKGLGYHQPTPLVPDLTSPTAVATWLEV